MLVTAELHCQTPIVAITVLLCRDESESYMKRQSDIYEGTFKEDLTSIQSDQRYRGGNVMRPR